MSIVEIVEWVKGIMLNRFRAVLLVLLYDYFVDCYCSELVVCFGDWRLCLYLFKWILMVGCMFLF